MAQISEDQFRSFAEKIINKSSDLNDGWDLKTVFRCENKTYLQKQHVIKVMRNPKETSCTVEANGYHMDEMSEVGTVSSCEAEDWPQYLNFLNNWKDSEADESCVLSDETITADVLKFDYHVLYSDSYAVPVLYFNVYRQDGSLVSLDDVWNLVPVVYQERLREERWTFITQQEHPYLGRPFYQLHPCHTANLMEQVISIEDPNKSGNLLVSWLSAVGPVVRLNLPLQYGKENS